MNHTAPQREIAAASDNGLPELRIAAIHCRKAGQRARPTAPGFGLVIAWLLLLLAGCAPPAATTSASLKTDKPVMVQTVAVAQTDVRQTSTQPATIHPFFRAEVRAQTSGYVKECKVDIGDYVEAGNPLAIIDVPELQIRRQVVESRVARSEAEEARAAAGVQLSIANIESAQAKRTQAESELRRVEAAVAAAEAEFNRTQDMVARQSLQNRVLDEVRMKRDSEVAAKASVAAAILSAEADVSVARAQQSKAEADLQAAQADTRIAKHQLEEVDAELAFATLVAPFSGVVTARAVDPGDLVREANEVGAGEPLFVISQINKVRVQVHVPERDAALVSPGDSLTLRFPSFPAEETISASVARTSSSLDPSTRTMLVEADLENPENRLLPGMFGEASIELSTKVAAHVLPARAVRFDETGHAYVYLVSSDDTVTITPVATGSDDGQFIEVLSGVTPGQMVIDSHLQRFADGQKIHRLNH